MEQLLRQARSLDPARCRECVQKCDQVDTTLEQKLEDVPDRSAVAIRLILVTAAVTTLVGLIVGIV